LLIEKKLNEKFANSMLAEEIYEQNFEVFHLQEFSVEVRFQTLKHMLCSSISLAVANFSSA